MTTSEKRPHDRKVYAAPILIEYGSMNDLTRDGNSGQHPDSQSNCAYDSTSEPL